MKEESAARKNGRMSSVDPRREEENDHVLVRRYADEEEERREEKKSLAKTTLGAERKEGVVSPGGKIAPGSKVVRRKNATGEGKKVRLPGSGGEKRMERKNQQRIGKHTGEKR